VRSSLNRALWKLTVPWTDAASAHKTLEILNGFPQPSTGPAGLSPRKMRKSGSASDPGVHGCENPGVHDHEKSHLGFTVYWERSRWGRWRMGCKTRSARLRRATRSVHDWCRRHRHLSIKDQHAALTRRLRGHFNYFGVNGNLRSLKLLVEATKPIWYKWLNRRSQRSRLTWERFHALLEQHPLPRPRITVQIWGKQP